MRCLVLAKRFRERLVLEGIKNYSVYQNKQGDRAVKKFIFAFILICPYQVNAEGGSLTQGQHGFSH